MHSPGKPQWHRFVWFLLLSFALVLAPNAASSQSVDVENVRAQVKSEGVIEITYDLVGPANTEYEVQLFLVSGIGGLPQSRRLENAAGDVGTVKVTGKGRRITWAMKAEFPNPVPGVEYLFEVTASIRTGGGLGWYVYAGAAVLVGGVAALAIKPSATGAAEPQKTIPLPPSR